MNYQYEVTGIFPMPILIASIPRPFSDLELSYFNDLQHDTTSNIGNKVSNNKRVLRESVLDRLNADCHNLLKCFVEKVYDPVDELEPYITQSWVNYTEQGQDHHKHTHPNSWLSGVVYINADPNYDKIYFHNEPYKFISPIAKEHNPFNCVSWAFPVKTGDVIIFPSDIPHSVETKAGNNTRVSLAFNSFVKGIVGSYEGTTELVL